MPGLPKTVLWKPEDTRADFVAHQHEQATQARALRNAGLAGQRVRRSAHNPNKTRGNVMSQLRVVRGEDHVFGRLTLRPIAPNDEALSSAPVFRSMEACLHFAYTQRAVLGVKVGEIKEYTGKEGGTLLLTTHEKKAQARFILDVIDSHLSIDQRAMLDATFGGENGERAAAIEHLMTLCAGMSSNRHLVELLLMREFIDSKNRSINQAAIARECGVHPATACRVAARIMHAIGDLRDSTYEKLRPAFERRGWCPRDGEK